MIKRKSEILSFFPIIVIGMIIYLLNYYTPLLVDDFNYTYIFGTNDRVTSISDVFVSQYNHYFIQNGRSVVHTLLQFFLLLGKPFFNFLNTGAFIFFVFLLMWHIYGKIKYNPYLYTLLSLTIWFSLPAFGQTILWMSGSVNYLWGAIIILLCLLPFRLYLNNQYSNSIILNIGMLFLGFLGGWISENTSGGLILLIILLMLYLFFYKIKIPSWMYITLFSSLVGFSFLLFSPGNQVRTSYSGYQSIIARILNVGSSFISEFGLYASICFGLIFLIYIGKNNKKEKQNAIVSFLYLVTSAAVYGVMILSPEFPDRAKFGSYSFLIIALFIVVLDIMKYEKEFNIIAKGIIIITTMFFMFTFYLAFKDISKTNELWEERIEVFNHERKNNKSDIEVQVMFPTDPHNALYGLVDLRSDGSKKPNSYVARYWGFNRIDGLFDNEPTDK